MLVIIMNLTLAFDKESARLRYTGTAVKTLCMFKVQAK